MPERVTYGNHLRGYVRVLRPRPSLPPPSWVWFGFGRRRHRNPILEWGVRNTATGKTIASDSTACSIEHAIDEADQLTAAAREAWMYEFRQKDLRS